METQNISVFLAFGAGLLSFLSPCVLPLVPVYLGYLTGSTVGQEATPPRSMVLLHALLFVLGFTLVFVVVFGLPVGLIGQMMVSDLKVWLARLGGFFLIVFGLHTIGLIKIPLLYVEKRLQVQHGTEPGYLRSGFVGMTFAAGWTPCVGPLLGAILTLAMGAQAPAQAAFFLLIYSLGLGVPFLLVALLLTTVTGQLRRLNRFLNVVSWVSGVFLIGVGFLLLSGTFQVLNTYFQRLTPPWLLRLL